EGEARHEISRPARDDARALLDHRGDLDSSMAQGQQRRKSDELAADDDGAAEGADLLQIDELLQGAGRDDAPGTVAADEAPAARRLADAEGQQNRSRVQLALAAFRVDEPDPAAGRNPGHGAAAADLDARRGGGEPPGISGATQQTVELAQSEGGMAAMARHAAR